MAAKNQASPPRGELEAQIKEAPSFVTRRLSRDEILSEAIRGLRADLSKVMERHSN